MNLGQQSQDQQLRGFLARLASHGMLRVALGAFIVGIVLHVCVLYAVLGDGGGGDRKPTSPSRAPAGGAPPIVVAATPTRTADRTSCDAIRGTEYRSEAERRWFLGNCS